MKWKVRMFILMAVSFILFVSFKILEPEIHAQNESEDGEVEHEHRVKNGGNLSNRRGDVIMTNNRNETAKAIIRWFLDRYEILWHRKLVWSPWKLAEKWLKPREIHPDHAPELGAILHDLNKAKIMYADFGRGGSQLKLTLTLSEGQRVVFRPRWYGRDDVIEGEPYAGGDRHNGEIAAFHLNRLLGFHRSPLVVGRVIDLKKEIAPVASDRLLKTFFRRGGNTCFYGRCLYCRGREDGVCANGTRMEGAVTLWLSEDWKLKMYRHPWSRPYVKNRKATWETFEEYCTAIRTTPLYSNGPRLLDILDGSVFDYLLGNADRHHYEVFKDHPDSMMILLDNGKSFGDPNRDEKTILAPVYQCCMLRRPTWERLQLLRDGVLSHVLRKVMENDPISPVLTEAHLRAMDRRVEFIVDILEDCIQKHGVDKVLLSDS